MIEGKCYMCGKKTHLYLKTRYSHQIEFRMIPICMKCYYESYGSEEE